MIIKRITIQNFRSYYGENEFLFSDGLTLIVGDNGDGKTTFFEALQWLFNTAVDNNSIDNVSEMKKTELDAGKREEVLVSMLFEHDGTKQVEKSFYFEKKNDGSFSTGPVVFRGYEGDGPEREVVSGKSMMDRCFDAFIQKFSMFKGESTLNVFENSTALKELVDKFSDVRKFDELVKLSRDMEGKADKAYIKECKSDQRISNQANLFEYNLAKLSGEITETRRQIKEKESCVSTFSNKLDDLEKNQESAERYNEVNARIKNLNEKISQIRGKIAEVDKNTALLDKLWVLCAFPLVLQEFKLKSSAFSKEKRRQNDDFLKQKAVERGKLEAIKEMRGALEGGATRLPWYLPNEETMEEMLHDHICKVCGRPAPEGSDAYRFMVDKLNEYREHVEAEAKQKTERDAIEQKELFTGHSVEDVHNLSISLSGSREEDLVKLKNDIFDRLSLEEKLKQDLEKDNKDCQDSMDEKARLLIQANVSEDVLAKDFSDIKGLFAQKTNAEVRKVELEGKLKELETEYAELKAQFDNLSPQGNQAVVYKRVHMALDAIANAFRNAKAENLRRFLGALEKRANDYLSRLSAKDFHGEIRLGQKTDDSMRIRLFSSNGTEIKSPSGSQATVMYMSVLFAISDFSNEKRDEKYPLIFDAATSSFGDSKEEEFYNVVDALNKQCIIVTKDFITKGQLRVDDIDKLTCGVYRICKAKGFDERDMSTIRTQVEKIK